MVRAARIDRTAELTPALAPEPESDRTAELSLDCAPPPAHGMASSPRVEALRTSTEAERSLRRQAEAELAKEMAVGRSLAAEVERLRAQLSSERSSGDGTAHPAESEPAGRAGRGGVLDHSLAALPLPALDHSLAAPPTAWPGASAAGEGEDASGSPVIRGSRRRRVRGERGLGGSRLSQSLDVASLASLSMQGLTPPPQYPPAPEPEPAEGPGAGLLSLRVNVVDETFTLPSLGPRQPYHGVQRELEVPGSAKGEALAATLCAGVPAIKRAGCGWCLCWSAERGEAGQQGGSHQRPRPGPRIECRHAGGGRGGGKGWTLEEAGVRGGELLWLRYMPV